MAVVTNAAMQYGNSLFFPSPGEGESYPFRSRGTWHDETGRFSLAQQLQGLAHPRWAALKELGNAALKAGEPKVALVWYRRAESLTASSNGVEAFFDVLDEGRARSAAAARLADARDDIGELILRCLPASARTVRYDAELSRRATAAGQPAAIHEAREPNLPRAICLSNMSAAALKTGDAELAFEYASDAAVSCPEYVKGQHRLVSALKAAGESDPEKRELAEHRGSRNALLKGQRRLAFNGIEMMVVGWIDELQFACVYNPAYFSHEARKIREVRPSGLIVLASLVPFYGVGGTHGQWLTIGAKFTSNGMRLMTGGASSDFSFECLHFCCLDPEHGADTQRPPHGHASALSKRLFPDEMCKFLARFVAETGVTPVQLTLGQGLRGFDRSIRKPLKSAGFGKMLVTASHSTHASNEAGMTTPSEDDVVRGVHS